MSMQVDSAADVIAFLRRASRIAPGALAVASPDGTLNYAQLSARVDALAGFLRNALGTARREPVAVVAEHDPTVPELYLGVMAAGHAVVPLSARLPDEALARVVSNSGSRMGILSPSVAARLKSVAATADTARWIAYGKDPGRCVPPDRAMNLPAGTAMICFTSGTTGEPKGVIL
ncbi:MAG: long-chain fatty acid--CoA ligase, partial [Betaproteobacteria bacterium]|nr:long-chain fatty acid--CoA ligase [Betaproteobacteria bacterium]